MKESLQSAVKTNDVDRAVQLLKQLQDAPVTASLLKTTQIGVVVGKLRKSDQSEISTVAQKVVAQWKGAITPKKTSAVETAKKAPATQPKSETVKESVAEKVTEATETPENAAPSLVKRDYTLGRTNDKVRDKIQTLVAGAIKCGDTARNQAIAFQIEESMFTKHGDSGKAYREHSRTILFNLRDEKNQEIHDNLSAGVFLPKDIVHMDVNELANSDVKAKRLAEQKIAIDAARCDWEPEGGDQGWVEIFKCPKCKGQKTKFKQKQIRSADEPMTTFIVCGLCKHRWCE